MASHLAQPEDEIILDNQGMVKATRIPRKGVVKDQDYHGYLVKLSTRSGNT